MSETETATEALENCMKYIPLILAAVILPQCSHAHEDDHIKNITQVINNYSTYQIQGVESAIAASQLHFDGNSHRYQIAIGTGNYAHKSAIAAGFSYKYGTKGPSISASITQNSSYTGIGAGITFGW